MIEEKFQTIMNVNEVKFQDMRAEFINAHAARLHGDQETADNINGRITTITAVVNALSTDFTEKFDAGIASDLSLDSQIHATHASLEASISDITGNVQAAANINIKEKT